MYTEYLSKRIRKFKAEDKKLKKLVTNNKDKVVALTNQNKQLKNKVNLLTNKKKSKYPVLTPDGIFIGILEFSLQQYYENKENTKQNITKAKKLYKRFYYLPKKRTKIRMTLDEANVACQALKYAYSEPNVNKQTFGIIIEVMNYYYNELKNYNGE